MTRRGQKERERRLLDAFMAAAEIRPTSVLPTEHPDFVLALDDCEIGVEMTDFARGANQPGGATTIRLASQRDAVLRHARDGYMALDGQPVRVFTLWTFGDTRRLDRNTIQTLATALAQLVLAETQRLPDRSSQPYLEVRVPWSTLDRAGLSDHIQDVWITKWYELQGDDEWVLGESGAVHLSVEALRGTVSAKEALGFDNWPDGVQERWLVIVLDARSWAELNQDVRSTPVASGFDRIYVFDDVHGLFALLPTAPERGSLTRKSG